jgi:hypothetical protein
MITTALGIPIFQDGILVTMDDQVLVDARQFMVIDSFPAGAFDYSMGLGADGEYLWNNEAFYHWFARMDTTGAVVNSFSTSLGNRDMTFDGQHLWASDWQTSSINMFDTSDCSLISTYYPPFYAGRPHGMAWDGIHLWVGEESGRIYQMTLTGDTVRSIPPPVYYSYDPRGLAFDGEFLWVGYQSSGLIYKVDTITGLVLDTYSAPGAVSGQRFQQGLACDGSYLWSTVGGAAQMIYKIDIGIVGSAEKQAQKHTPIFTVSINPFRIKTTLSVTLPQQSNLKISILDASGRIVDILENRLCPPGYHIYAWRNDAAQSGVYFALMETNIIKESVKLIKLR